jgi:hypothetical protein
MLKRENRKTIACQILSDLRLFGGSAAFSDMKEAVSAVNRELFGERWLELRRAARLPPEPGKGSRGGG